MAKQYRPISLTNLETEDDLNEELTNICTTNELIVLQYTAGFCKPCLRMKNLIFDPNTNKGFSTEYSGKVKFFFIDFESSKDLCDSFSIISVPTFYIGRLIKNKFHKLEVLKGANPEKLVSTIDKFVK